jgi:hypothetical protein
MFYIKVSPTDLPLEISDEMPTFEREPGFEWAKSISNGRTGRIGWMSSRDFDSFEEAERMARYLTAMTGEMYLATDEGSNSWPQYRVIEAPVIGDEVSKSFNGDSYPCGEIVKITPTWQITTSTGAKFRRYKMSGGFRETGRGFWMISGHVYEQNPSF